jgi:hypothetical protein
MLGKKYTIDVKDIDARLDHPHCSCEYHTYLARGITHQVIAMKVLQALVIHD